MLRLDLRQSACCSQCMSLVVDHANHVDGACHIRLDSTFLAVRRMTVQTQLTLCVTADQDVAILRVGPRESADLYNDAMSAIQARDQRRRTHVMLEDVSDADQPSTVHFLTPELAARSALFRG